MRAYTQFFAVNFSTGATLPGATVDVYATGTTTRASLYNATGGAIGNPLTATAQGLVAFAVDNGVYDIQVTSGAYTAPLMAQVQLIDELAAVNAAAAAQSAATAAQAAASAAAASASTSATAAAAAQASAAASLTAIINKFTGVGISDPVVANYDAAFRDVDGKVFAGVIKGDFWMKYAGSSAQVAQAPNDTSNLARSLNVKQPAYLDIGYLSYTNLIMSAGQSFSTGTAARENLSRTPRSDCFMMGLSVRGASSSGPSWSPQGGSTGLTPMVATVDNSGGSAVPFDDATITALPPAGAWGEDILQAAVRGLARGCQDRPFGNISAAPIRFVANSSGVGGTAIAEWAPGASPNIFNRITNIFAAFKNEATNGTIAGNQPYGCPAIEFEQGQQDITLGTAEAAYISGFETFQDAVHAQLVSQFGQTWKPAWFMNQTWGHYAEDNTQFAVPNAQLQLSWDHPEIFLVGPDGYVPDNREVTNAHPVSNGHRWLSSQYAKVMRRVLVERRGWEPLSPLWMQIVGNSIFLGLMVPEPPLQIKPVWEGLNPKLYPNAGFAVEDATGFVPIKQVGFAGATIVEIQMVNPLQGDPSQIFVTAGTKSQSGCSNICDSDPTLSEDLYEFRADLGMRSQENIASLVGKPYDLSNFLCCFRLPVSWSR